MHSSVFISIEIVTNGDTPPNPLLFESWGLKLRPKTGRLELISGWGFALSGVE
jgi:hypothetical protein